MLSPTNNNTNYSFQRGISAINIVLLLLLAVVVIAVIKRQDIFDWWMLRDYSPPAAITTLAKEDTMTPYALKVFEVNHPSIESQTTFNVNCPNNGGEKTIVLGCYHSGQSGIFLLNVNDPRLNGVEQVTAAHEMLHAAYQRLSPGERSKVDAMLLNYYNHDLHDQRIISTIAEYKQTEPDAVVNEMHSVFGTEIANLPAPLEAYYKRYFTNRQTIAAYAAQYETEFTSRQAEVAADDTQLASWNSQINNIEADLSARLSRINAEQAQLNNYKNSGDTAPYNAAVPGYNQQIGQYNNEVIQVRSLVNSYNTLVAQRNSVALIENQLYQELSGKVPSEQP